MSIAAVESASIVMDPEQARAKARALRKLDDRHRTEEHRALLSVLRKLGAEARVIDVNLAIGAGGLDDNGRPRLAIARADRREVWYYRPSWNGTVGVFVTHEGNIGSTWMYRTPRLISRRTSTAIPVDFAGSSVEEPPKSAVEGYADVPLVPAEHHPGCDLKNRFVLWEVDEWRSRSRTARPSRDPYLLRHLHGSLYEIEAEWDLTDLELAIIGGVRSGGQ